MDRLIAPYLHDGTMTSLAKAVSVAYPLGDVVLLAAAIRLALDGGRRGPAFHLMISSIVLLLVTDYVYGLMTLHGTYQHQLWVDVGLDRLLRAVGRRRAAPLDDRARPRASRHRRS